VCTVKRLRNLLVAAPIAGVLAVTGLAAGAQPADAFVTVSDYCQGYTAGYIYWGNQATDELTRNNFEETPYFNYAYARAVAYGKLMDQYNCP
jgi:hypothetical protein